MRYAAAEKLEIIRLVEQSSLSVRRTLDQLGIPRSTFYCWYDRYRAGHAEGLHDRSPAPRRVWNKLPAAPVTQAVLEARAQRAGVITAGVGRLVRRLQRRYFVSEASVYRLLKAHDLDHQSRLHPDERRPTASPIQPPHPISSGKPTLPTCG